MTMFPQSQPLSPSPPDGTGADQHRLTYANIIREAVNAVADSVEIHNWCMATYGLPPSVRNDVDPLSPPTEGDCPLVAFSPIGGERGQDRDVFVRGFIVRVAVSDAEKEITDDPATGRILKLIHRGTDRVSYLLEALVYKALRRHFNQLGVPLSTADEQIEPVQGTLFEAKAGISIIFELAIGEEYPFIV